MNDEQKLIVAQSVIIGEALGCLTGLSWHDDVSAELREKIEQIVADLQEKYSKAQAIIPGLTH